MCGMGCVDCGFNGGEMTLSLADRWILAEFNQTIKAYREALVSSRYQSQNWFQVNSYRMPAAISKRKLSSASRYALMVWLTPPESSDPPATASFHRR